MDTPVLRMMEEKDAACYRALFLTALKESPERFEVTLEEAESRDLSSYAAELRTGDGLGCFFGSELVGMVFLRRVASGKSRHRGSITKFYVDSGFRGRRIAYALLTLAGEVARHRNISQLELLVSSTAARARDFYAAAGFRETGLIPNAFVEGGKRLDLFLMVLDLQAEAAEALCPTGS